MHGCRAAALGERARNAAPFDVAPTRRGKRFGREAGKRPACGLRALLRIKLVGVGRDECEVDQERDEQRKGRLDARVANRLVHAVLALALHLAGKYQARVQAGTVGSSQPRARSTAGVDDWPQLMKKQTAIVPISVQMSACNRAHAQLVGLLLWTVLAVTIDARTSYPMTTRSRRNISCTPPHTFTRARTPVFLHLLSLQAAQIFTRSPGIACVHTLSHIAPRDPIR
eukprot:6205199-Pleurochrysis_carterae.AAC.1